MKYVRDRSTSNGIKRNPEVSVLLLALPPVQPHNEDKGLSGFRQRDIGGYLTGAQCWVWHSGDFGTKLQSEPTRITSFHML